MKHMYSIAVCLLIIPLQTTNDFEINTKHNNKKTLAEPTYQLAFANFGPLNTDIYIADADGKNATALLPDPGLDYNASFSPDDKWVVFTSDRNGSSDIYRVHPDGSGMEQLTNDPSFDDQAVFSPFTNSDSLPDISRR